jgi:hypothetical protein
MTVQPYSQSPAYGSASTPLQASGRYHTAAIVHVSDAYAQNTLLWRVAYLLLFTLVASLPAAPPAFGRDRGFVHVELFREGRWWPRQSIPKVARRDHSSAVGGPIGSQQVIPISQIHQWSPSL